MKETKRQHYVPQTYLKKFATKRKKRYNIHAAKKNKLGKIIFPNIINVCAESNLYTLSGKTEEQRQALEIFYSENIENVYNEVYGTLTNDHVTDITEAMHYNIIMTIITMMYRTSKWIHWHNDFMDSVLEKMYSLCKQQGKDYFLYEGVKYSIKGKSLVQLQKEFRSLSREAGVITQLEVAFRLIEIRKYDGILVNKLVDMDQLITSDNPVILSNINPGHIVPFDPENMIRLPLDSSHILTIMPHSLADGSHTIDRISLRDGMSKAKMISNNSSQFASAFKFILGTKKGLLHFILSKKEYEKPISEEQEKELDELYSTFKLLTGT